MKQCFYGNMKWWNPDEAADPSSRGNVLAVQPTLESSDINSETLLNAKFPR